VSKFPFVYSLSGYSRNAKVAMLPNRQPWVQQIMRNFLYTVSTAEPFFVSVILRTTISTGGRPPLGCYQLVGMTWRCYH